MGVTNYGQGELGRVLSVELPEVGDKVEKGEPFAELESHATVAELRKIYGLDDRDTP